MPKLTKQTLDQEVKRILSNIPADQVETTSFDERTKLIYQKAYDRGWNDFKELIEQQ